MSHVRPIAARSLVVVLALLALVPSHAVAQSQAPVTAPTPAVVPAPSGTPIPYPAYGSPAPDVASQTQRTGIPTEVTLTQAVDLAVAQSPAFASQRAQYLTIAAKYGAEKGALFPSVSGSASITRNIGSAGTGTSGGSSGASSSSLVVTNEDARASLTQLIYDGGRVIAGIRTAKEEDVAGRDTLLRQLQTLAFNVATAYYNVLSANASVTSEASLVRQFETQEQVVQAQIRTGAAARSDLAAAQFQTAQARGALVAAQGQVIASQATFATTLGFDADAQVNPQPLAASPAQVRIYSYAQSLQQALTLRPDYLAAQHTVESSRENLRFAKLARFPVLNANASAGSARTLIATPSGAAPFTGSSSVGATLTIPIYDQGLTNFNVATAASQLDQANAGLVSSKLTVESDVRGALSTLISARSSLVQAQAELTSAQVTSQAVGARYRVGAATIIDVVTANATLSTAERDDVAALYNERLSEERYTFALGTSDLKL